MRIAQELYFSSDDKKSYRVVSECLKFNTFKLDTEICEPDVSSMFNSSAVASHHHLLSLS